MSRFMKAAVKILVVGIEGTDKHAVSKCLIGLAGDLRLSVLTCSCLPLPDHKNLIQEEVSFICFMVHMTRKDSLEVLVDSLGQVDVSYFAGKSVIVANTKGHSTDAGIQPKLVTNLATKYNIDVLFADTENEMELTGLCRRLVQMIETAVCRRHNVTPLLYDSVQISRHQILGSVDTTKKTPLDPRR